MKTRGFCWLGRIESIARPRCHAFWLVVCHKKTPKSIPLGVLVQFFVFVWGFSGFYTMFLWNLESFSVDLCGLSRLVRPFDALQWLRDLG